MIFGLVPNGSPDATIARWPTSSPLGTQADPPASSPMVTAGHRQRTSPGRARGRSRTGKGCQEVRCRLRECVLQPQTGRRFHAHVVVAGGIERVEVEFIVRPVSPRAGRGTSLVHRHRCDLRRGCARSVPGRNGAAQQPRTRRRARSPRRPGLAWAQGRPSDRSAIPRLVTAETAETLNSSTSLRPPRWTLVSIARGRASSACGAGG